MKESKKMKWASPSKEIKFPKKTKMSEENQTLLKKIRNNKGKFG